MQASSRALSELAELVGGVVVEAGADPVVTEMTHDSREVTDGSLYVALRGSRSDGHDYVAEAVQSGAVAVCVDHEVSTAVSQLIVEDTRAVIGELAAAVHDYPSTALDVVGVTGTNGKTTVTHYVESIARHAGVPAGVIGTIHARGAGETMAATLTTPEAPELQRILAAMRDRGVRLVATEVSSHALEYGRTRGTRFAVAAFTNMSQDHLDFHGDMDAYRAAKERLFTEYEVGAAVINIDDAVGADIARSYPGRLLAVGEGGDVRVSAVAAAPGGGTSFVFTSPWGEAVVEAAVLGRFNVTNLAMAGTCTLALGLGFDDVVAGMRDVAGVPGRFEVVSGDEEILVIVDYAHTPEGVARAVETGRDLSRGRVIGLIGAGGDRDREKRPAMGAAISEADFAVITTDNPRSENPELIAAAVLSGVVPGTDYVLELDRREAIDRAIGAAEGGDVVLILGRGHEPIQDLGTETVPFDDRVVAREALSRRRRSAGSGGRSGSMSA
jgi:UDP-N-acetylmuramoyl-L-alanyl-D-glutamate--2,6-diaminopimelate ligase